HVAHDLELHPVMMRIGVLLADAHRALRGEAIPERGLGDLVAGSRVEHLRRQPGGFDAAHGLDRPGRLAAVDAAARCQGPEQRSRHESDATPAAVDLPYLTADLPGCGGTLRTRDEDFVVDEEPAYLPAGTGDHVF